MKFYVLTALTLLIKIVAYGQASSIKWQENKSLKWEDFSGQVDDTSRFDAASYAEICYNYTFYDPRHFKFIVDAKFDKQTSWSRKDKQSEDLLKHEQLHFDIAQLFANKLKQDFENFNYTDNYQEEIVQLFNRRKLQYKLMQHQYDEETNHSLIKDKQKEWENYIGNELRGMEFKLQLVKNDNESKKGGK